MSIPYYFHLNAIPPGARVSVLAYFNLPSTCMVGCHPAPVDRVTPDVFREQREAGFRFPSVQPLCDFGQESSVRCH